MTALAAPRKGTITKPHGLVRTWQKLVDSGETIYENAIVALDPSVGKWVEGTADPTLIVYGLARCANVFDNADGTNTHELLVDSACARFFSTGLTDADEGKTVYLVDDQTFTLTPSATKPVLGQLVEVISATEGYVWVEPPSAHDGAGDDTEILTKGADLGDASPTIQLAAGSWRALPAATLTQARTLTLGTTGAKAGDRMRITRLDVTGFTYTIANGGVGAGTLVILPGGEQASVEAVFDGTDWALLHVGAVVPDHVVGAALTDASPTITRGGRRSLRTLPAATLSVARTLTLGTTGAQLGDVIRIVRLDLTGFAYTIANGGVGAGTLGILPGGLSGFLEAYYDGTNWLLLGEGSLAVDTVAGAALTNADATIQRGGRVSWRALAAATLTVARALTLGTTGAQLGDVMIVTIGAQGFVYTITNGGGGGGNPVVFPTGMQGAAVFYFDGTNWLYQWGGTLETDWVIGTGLTDTATQSISRGGRKSLRTLASIATQDGVLTLNATNALAGDVMRIVRTGAEAHTYTIKNNAAATLVVMPNSKANFAEFLFTTDWILTALGTQ